MNNQILIDEYEKLPSELQKEVNDFIRFLIHKNNLTVESNKKVKSRGGFGILKGKISISDDFDEPLGEFKEYMI